MHFIRKLKKYFAINKEIINLIRRLIIKLIIKLDKLTNFYKINHVLDKRTKLELSLHYLNFYKSYLPSRLKTYKTKSLKTSNIYSINRDMEDSLFSVDINKFVGYEGAYYLNKDSPFVKTVIQLMRTRNLKVEDSFLFDFFNKFQPKNYGELYGLSKNNKLYSLSSTTIFMPWIHQFPVESFHAGVFGPKDKSSIKHRLLRLKNIINNINLYGYIPTEEDCIEGYIAILDNDYRFVITGGHHRVAVLKALNKLNSKDYNLINVKYDLMRVNYKDVTNKEINDWPGIKSGYVNSVDSLEFFEKYFT